MKVAVMTRLLAKRDMDVYSAHLLVFSRSRSFQLLRLKTATENYFLTRSSFCFTKASQPV
jgi:hypothetical protein